MATFDDFMKLDIRVGTIVEVAAFEKAKKPASSNFSFVSVSIINLSQGVL